MPSTRDIRRRIRSVQSTRKITRAMNMVSAAKLRRAQDQMMAARPYTHRLQAVLRSLASRANPDAHPLLAVRPEERIELVVVTADKGLCGAFNTNILKQAQAFVLERKGAIRGIHCVGRKGRDFFRRRSIPIAHEYLDVFRKVEASKAKEIAQDLVDRYTGRELDAIYIVYNEFKSLIQQRVVVERLLPIDREEVAEGAAQEDYIYEPDAASLYDALLPRYVGVSIYHALVESAAAEHGARRAAMDAATSNADEMIGSLTLFLNRVRQASITKEIIEVVSGAQAL